MSQKRILNITNGDSLTDKLLDYGYDGEILTWSEMLCEGPTTEFIGSDTYVETRKQFFSTYYDCVFKENEFLKDLKKLDHLDPYNEIVLWFEYDLFCHINLLAVLALLVQKRIDLPIYLVSSGYTKKEHTLKGLSELSERQLKDHYKNRIKLSEDDKNLGYSLWKIYCGKDHNLFKPFITKETSFKYLNNCLKAHLTRFPNSLSGLEVLESNILKIIEKNKVKSEHHLLGYILNYQGFYGYGDLQLKRIIEKLRPLFETSDKFLSLNNLGKKALNAEHNMSAIVYNDMVYGGINRLDYQYSDSEKCLIKPNFDGNSSL